VQIDDEPALGWTLVLRRQPVHLVAGRPEGGYTDAYELICCYCGDDPDLDYRDISPDLRCLRGPYRLSAGIEAYQRHDRIQHGPEPGSGAPALAGRLRLVAPDNRVPFLVSLSAYPGSVPSRGACPAPGEPFGIGLALAQAEFRVAW
jgi:hypothetical protein